MAILTGGEDGRLCGWDLNSQEQVIDTKLDSAPVSKMLISTLDHDSRHDIVAACGNFKGVYLSPLP